MSVWSTAGAAPLPLFGTEGALVSVSISIESPHLEALLDVLARLDFPINPQIYHATGPDTVVEFPAYENRLPEIRMALEARGFPGRSATATAMLESIRAVQGAGME